MFLRILMLMRHGGEQALELYDVVSGTCKGKLPRAVKPSWMSGTLC